MQPLGLHICYDARLQVGHRVDPVHTQEGKLGVLDVFCAWSCCVGTSDQQQTTLYNTYAQKETAWRIAWGWTISSTKSIPTYHILNHSTVEGHLLPFFPLYTAFLAD